MPNSISSVCPDCSGALQAFYVKSGDGQMLLELDGCRRCRGLWLDRGELEKVVGKPLELTHLGGVTDRKCARCRRGMTTLLADGGVPLEHCDACRGVFLDAGELEQLGAPHVAGPAAEALKGRVVFQCLQCQGNFPLTQGNAMRDGLVCGNCVPKIGELPLERFVPDLDVENMGTVSSRLASGGSHLGILLDLLEVVAVLF